MLLRKGLLILSCIDIEPTIGYDTTFVERILFRVGQGNKFIILLEIRKVET